MRARASSIRRGSWPWVKDLDPTRLVNQASGGGYAGVGDIYDLHLGNLVLPPLKNDEAMVIGEYGGLFIHVPGHAWDDNKGGPVDPAANASTLDLYEKNLLRIPRSPRQRRLERGGLHAIHRCRSGTKWPAHLRPPCQDGMSPNSQKRTASNGPRRGGNSINVGRPN